MNYTVPSMADCSRLYSTVDSSLTNGATHAIGHLINETDSLLYATNSNAAAPEEFYITCGLQVPNGWYVQMQPGHVNAKFKLWTTGTTGPAGTAPTPTINATTGYYQTATAQPALLIKQSQDTYILVSPGTITHA